MEILCTDLTAISVNLFNDITTYIQYDTIASDPTCTIASRRIPNPTPNPSYKEPLILSRFVERAP
jgi:hypothetical protein